jgi:hypothetical protein
MARKPKPSTTNERVVDGNSSTRSQAADLAPPGAGALECNVLDEILTLQLLVAWAGEGLSDPPRLGWWRTMLVDEFGGEDLFKRLTPRT